LDKISSILPGNARIQSVDTENSQAARPGASTLGRHAGISTVHDRVSLSEAARHASLEDSFKDTMGGARSKDMQRAKMVAEINRNFFENRVKPVAEKPPAEETAETAMETADTLNLPQKNMTRDSARDAIIARYSHPALPLEERSAPTPTGHHENQELAVAEAE
jgi:hypothetical protein